jgi:acyl carrier protein
MNKTEIRSFLISTILNDLEVDEKVHEINLNTPVVGSNSPIDSMGLVQLCLCLEDKAEELGFDFDWTAENAMSRSRGMFKSIDSLSDEFLSQYAEKR